MKLNENNVTRNMLHLIRESDEASSLIDVTPEEFDNATTELRKSTGDNSASVVSFKVYPQEENVIMVIKLPSLGDATIQLIYKEINGIFLNANNAKLDSDNLRILNGLSGYYDNFGKTWEAKLRDEYKL